MKQKRTSEVGFPLCLTCKEEGSVRFLNIPDKSTKTFPGLICTNCGVYVGNGNTRGINPVCKNEFRVLEE